MQKLFRGTCFPGSPLLTTAFFVERQASLVSPMPSLRLSSFTPSLRRNPNNPGQSAAGIGRAFFGRVNPNVNCGSAWLSCRGARRSFSAVEASEKGEKCGESVEEVEAHEEEKKEKVIKSAERRNRGGNSVNEESMELLAIPGIGPRNLRKLVDKGYQGVAQLKQLYRDQFFGKSNEKMVEFLQSSVGIIHKNHAESITTFIRESVDEEIKEESTESGPKLAKKNKLTFCVEGNISVGKTTFLQRIANETLELRDLAEVVPEPISKWQDVGHGHHNVLDVFYANPERYAYTFQSYVFFTRLFQERESAGGLKPLRLMERSVFSDRMVFVRAVHEAKWMDDLEVDLYDAWFDPFVSFLPGLIPDGFIYLRASPDTCHRRMLHRKRAEEGGVSLDYLRGLHEKHESWLFPPQSAAGGILSISSLPGNLESSLHPEIKDRVFYLEGNHMHSSIQKVPTLVLDCEPDIDFNRDIDAKRQYARQVAEFFEFVKREKETLDARPGSTDIKEKTKQQIVLPRSTSLWVPGGIPSSVKLEERHVLAL